MKILTNKQYRQQQEHLNFITAQCNSVNQHFKHEQRRVKELRERVRQREEQIRQGNHDIGILIRRIEQLEEENENLKNKLVEVNQDDIS